MQDASQTDMGLGDGPRKNSNMWDMAGERL